MARSSPSGSSSSQILQQLGLRFRSSFQNEKSTSTISDASVELNELNEALRILSEIFPDVRIDVLREMLTSLGRKSRVYFVTDALLREKESVMKSRRNVRLEKGQRSGHAPTAVEASGNSIPLEDQFRSPTYRDAVRQAFKAEFRSLSESSINAVLAENNSSYSQARPTLVALSSKSWRAAISSFLFRRKKPAALDLAAIESCPFVERSGASSLGIRSTGCFELDKELYDTIVAPLKRQQRAVAIQADRDYAHQINEEDAKEVGAIYECECCFTSYPFEQVSACNLDSHFICFRCIRLAIGEAMFGQGWASSMNVEQNSLKCLAPTSSVCCGSISLDTIHRALKEEDEDDKVYAQLERRFATEALSKTDMSLIRCPFCSYAEVDDIYLDKTRQLWTFDPQSQALISDNWFLVPLISLIGLILLLTWILQPEIILQTISNSVRRISRKRRTQKFQCQAPSCRRVCCINCFKPWQDPHHCFQSEKLRYATFMENALSSALKRTCPRCSVSFVKSSGCNKLTCVCGYKMCYICRKELAGPDGNYSHFCEHFRPRGGNCVTCEKCDLYRNEDEQLALTRAKKEAERIWAENEGISFSEMSKGGEESFWSWETKVDEIVEKMFRIPS